MSYKTTACSAVSPDCLKISYLKPKAFYHSDLKESLEHIVYKEETHNGKDLLDKMFFDKTKNLKATIKALFNEILLREKIDSHVLNKIDDDISKQNTHLLNLDNLNVRYTPDKFLDLKDRRKEMEDNVLELEKEKRKEYLECWRDLMFMKKYLFSALKDYWDFSRRRDALTYDHGKNEDSKGYRGDM